MEKARFLYIWIGSMSMNALFFAADMLLLYRCDVH